jgi:CHASE2 domain-containing sensor protein
MRALPTAPLAGGSLIAGYAVVAATGSRPLGGLVLAAGGLGCIVIWRQRHGTRTAAQLGAVGLAAFVASHVLALAVGPWPSVLIAAAATAAATWLLADARPLGPAATLAFRPPSR